MTFDSDSTVFTQTSCSPSGAPDILFRFAGHTCKAELAGALLYAEMRDDGGIDMRLTNVDSEVLADLVVLKRSHRNDTENLMDVGSALLWSHWRYVDSGKAPIPSPGSTPP